MLSPQTQIFFQVLHFSLWCKHQDWGKRVCWPLPKGLLHPDHWWHQGVIFKYSEEHSFFFRSMRVCLGTKHRFSITACQSWSHLQQDMREVRVLSVTMQVLKHSTSPILSSMREELNLKKRIVGKRYEIQNMAWRKLPMIWKRVARKGAKGPNKCLSRMKMSSA